MQTSAFWRRITSLYRFQASPAVLCMQNSMICTRMTSLYWFQPLSVCFFLQTVTLGPVLKVCMGPRPHVWFCACKSATLAHELLVSIGPSHRVWFWMQNSDFWTGITRLCRSRPHLLFLNAKLRLLDQNNKSLWVPDKTCHFVLVQQRA